MSGGEVNDPKMEGINSDINQLKRKNTGIDHDYCNNQILEVEVLTEGGPPKKAADLSTEEGAGLGAESNFST